jgi:hypothetical protein
MIKSRWVYAASSACAGLILVGLGWGLSNFYLVIAGAVVLASAVAWLSIPMPTIL